MFTALGDCIFSVRYSGVRSRRKSNRWRKTVPSYKATMRRRPIRMTQIDRRSLGIINYYIGIYLFICTFRKKCLVVERKLIESLWNRNYYTYQYNNNIIPTRVCNTAATVDECSKLLIRPQRTKRWFFFFSRSYYYRSRHP